MYCFAICGIFKNIFTNGVKIHQLLLVTKYVLQNCDLYPFNMLQETIMKFSKNRAQVIKVHAVVQLEIGNITLNVFMNLSKK